jgi:uncharacterized BrkB/YihY/UPF0761 family membrane protein
MYNKEKYQMFGMLAIILIALLLIIFVPIATIWALNTLFPILAIPYNFWSWLAVIILNTTLFGAKNLIKGKQ